MGKDVQPLQSVKTGILAVLTVRAALGVLILKMMSLLSYYVYFVIVYAMS